MSDRTKLVDADDVAGAPGRPNSGEVTPEWKRLADVYDTIGPPGRPTAEDVDRVGEVIAGSDGNVLQLGVTPEYHRLGATLTAVEGSQAMIQAIWPGDGPGRRARLGDWLDLPFPDSTFDAVVGDGSLNSVAESLPQLLASIRHVLADGGVAAIRTFCAPDAPEPLEAIGVRPVDNCFSLRIRVAMSLAARSPAYVVSMADIIEGFGTVFPDRARLAAETGWKRSEIDRLDIMRDSGLSVCYPTRGFLRTLAEGNFREVRFVENRGYPLAELCPIVVLTT